MLWIDIGESIPSLWSIAKWGIGVVWHFKFASLLVVLIIQNPVNLLVIWIWNFAIVKFVKVIWNGRTLDGRQILCAR